MMKNKFFAFLFFLSSMHCASVSNQTFEVEIANGKLVGEHRGHFYAFEGIPYAEAPIGGLRFEPPKPYTQKWSIPRDAKKTGAVCVQWSDKLEVVERLIGNEDCLFINVYTNSLEGKKVPVFVYIHGGAFMFGRGDDYGLEMMMTREAIVVNFNYRLGPLGFLSTEDEVVPGNMGLKDQVEALKWVQKNIAAFGGDPKQVTLTGFSAGAASVHLHYFSPLSVGLLKNGISHSGCALNPWVFMENGKERAQKLAKIVRCSTDTAKEMIDCLKVKPAETLISATKKFQPWIFNNFSPFAATLEPQVAGAFLTEKPINLIIEGKFQRLPWLASATEAEGLYPAAEFLSRKEYLPYIDEHWNEVIPLILHYNDKIPVQSLQNVSEEIRYHYLGSNKLNDLTFPYFVKMVSDRMYNYGISQAIRVHGTVAPAFFYHFRYKPVYSSVDVSKLLLDIDTKHGEDIQLLHSYSILNESTTDVRDDIKMIGKLLDMYFSFSKTGVPSLGNYTIPLVKLNKGNYLRHASIDGPDTIFTADLDDFGEEEFWTNLGFDENVHNETIKHIVSIKNF